MGEMENLQSKLEQKKLWYICGWGPMENLQILLLERELLPREDLQMKLLPNLWTPMGNPRT